ncbi:probable tRNA (guanine(26)-N(2))-dimethyltransferase isoform X2 [Thrips palmi]|nr:probable tRNA (guanine(26)-N(2))-dimethyltransferase isoform X2 [Thrips palmi]XP_034252733.1 probable tRNA (guanine(26)-N(2))-dimethyltransferase isoform X2 [Thrips palmi]XP_034252734.1 probable tRNA (guanine(26)-N(2))-dimethyltransferase isoform X2 [Thrips palmi]
METSAGADTDPTNNKSIAAEDVIPLSDGTIKEGKATILKETSKHVFYNPVQEFNRDLSILVLSVHAEDHFKQKQDKKLKEKKRNSASKENNESEATAEPIPDLEPGKSYEDGMIILEALAATGLRSIRYAKEVPGIKQIVANDLSPSAVESLKANIAYNKVEHLVSASHNDASMVMYLNRPPAPRFDVVDLDPYGCPSHFLDGAVQSVASGGLLMVTCTDMAVLAGNSPETCYSKYGAISLRNRCCYEMALRIALQCIESHANRYGRYITPLLSVSADFYIRTFVRIDSSPSVCKRSINKLSLVYQCVGCETLTLQPMGEFKSISEKNPNQMKTLLPHVPSVSETCPHCDMRYHLGGPIWNAPIHDKSFVSRLLDVVTAEDAAEKFGTCKRIEGMLSVVEEELEDIPLYYKLDRLSSLMGISTMPVLTFSSAILNAGYRLSQSHCKPSSFKTDAPQKFVWDVLRAWEKENPASEKRLKEGTVSAKLLSKAITHTVDFKMHPEANPDSRQRGKCRYQINPLKFWGPGIRSIANLQDGSIQEKQRRNQGKNAMKRKRTHTTGDAEDESKKLEESNV